MSEFNGKEKVSASIIFASSDGNVVKCLCQEEDTKQPGQFSLYLKKYDEKKRSYVADEDVRSKLIENLNAMGLEDYDEDTTDFDNLAKDLKGTTFDAYFDGERFSLRPIQKRVQYDKLETADAKYLEKNSMTMTDLECSAVSEFPGFRFDFFVTVDVKGENKTFRISQLILESDDEKSSDVVVGVKYRNKTHDTFAEGLGEDSDLDDDTKAELRKNLDILIAESRKNKVEELENVFGFNVDDILSGDVEPDIQIDRLKVNQISGQDVYFLGAYIKVD